MEAFLGANGPLKLIFFHQVEEREVDGEYQPVPGGKTTLFLTDGEHQRARGRCLYFVRDKNDKPVDVNKIEVEINYGEIQPGLLDHFYTVLSQVLTPAVSSQEWGKCSEEDKGEFNQQLERFNHTLQEAAMSLQGGIELRKPDSKRFQDLTGPTAHTRAANDPDMLAHCESVVEDWCSQTEGLLVQEAPRDADDAGPDSELTFWRNRMAKFNSVAEQLKSKEARMVLGVVTTAKSKIFKRWKHIDNSITDSLNEAKDNVKYLATLDKYTEPLYHGEPQQIIEALPGLMNNAKMMLTIARYYSTSERMTILFCKITNQMITKCKKHVMQHGRLWDQPVEPLLENLHAALRLNEAYQEQYRITKEKLATQPKVKQFDFNESDIFGKFDLFCKRIQKLIDMFTTIQQFSSLAQHEIEGMDNLIKSFIQIVEDFKRKPYDLLNYSQNTFDRDFLEFNVNVAELETALQGFINASFENITSTEHALSLLKQFESILQRETLKSDLDSKYTVIFHNYGLDLETVQKIYDKQKSAPPTIRNAPPVAGNILWSRQLLRRIEQPMKRFKSNKNIMTTKESKKIIRTYNKVARALIEYETLWHHAWCKSIEAAKSGLQATLIIRHPRSGMLFVNFDREILQLIREAKFLQRMGIDVPESARMVLLQEDKFKSYLNELTFALKEYERVLALVPPVCKPIIRPHLEDLDRKIQPGMVLLTWQSMNIDGYLHRLHTGVGKLEELIHKINDIMDNRIEFNLKHISRTMLVDLPQNQSFTLDQLVSLQERMIKTKSALMDQRNLQVERAVDDLVDTVVNFPLESEDLQPDTNEINKLRSHYERLMYTAVLHATKQSFWALKDRLSSKQGAGIMVLQRPFFEVEVELSVPNIQMNPGLEDIQSAVNRAALHILRATKKVYIWGQDRSNVKHLQSFHRQIAQDKEIVKIVLLLTGAVEGAKTQINDYLTTFDQYNYLWQNDKQKAYDTFMKTEPDIESFSKELKKYMDVEREIRNIPSVHVIGCMCLDSSPLMDSLISEAVMWKAQYGRNMHEEAKAQLVAMQDYFKAKTRAMNHEFGQDTELEEVRDVMTHMTEIREKEATIESEIGPIKERFELLMLYEHEVPAEELEELADLKEQWGTVKKKAFQVSGNLQTLQTGFRSKLLEGLVEFIDQVKEFRAEFEAKGPMRPGMAPIEAAEALKTYQRYYETMDRKWKTFSEGEEMFALEVTQYPELEQTAKELGLLDKLYSLYTEAVSTIDNFADILWTEVVANIEQMNEDVGKLQTRCKTMPKALRDWDAYNELKRKIDDFLEILPLLTALSGPAMQERHWNAIQEVTKSTLDMNPDTFKLAHLLAIGSKEGELTLLQCAEEVEDICGGSAKELAIEVKLKQLSEDWSERRFAFANFKTRGPVILAGKELGEIMEALEESQMVLGGMASNRYSAPFREEVTTWIKNLSTCSDVVEQWVQVQNLWIYMEAVFSSGDIAKQLPQEAKRFSSIDKGFMKVTAKAFEEPLVIQCCCENELMSELLPHLMEQLEMCQKSLTGYLETKKNCFPRFYFCSDGVLLEILSQGSDPHMVVQHLQNVFDSLAGMIFDKQKKNTMSIMISNDQEEVPFSVPMDAKGNVEDYLNNLVDSMRETMRDLCRECGGEAGSLTCQDIVAKYPAQICILALQFDWTTRTQDALTRAKVDKTGLTQAAKKEEQLLKDLIQMTLSELNKLDRVNVQTLITIDVHQVEISQFIAKAKNPPIRDPQDFEWLKQARFYWNYEKDACIISICDVDFEYNDEYLGCKERLCITPLTDRCYVTLSQAIGMFLGGAPAGPAGTGKTETTKDMARTLGIFCVVFNCSDQFDYKFLGSIYKGLAMAGCWGCFDEFNRINLDVLSVAAQQVACVLQAQRERKSEFVFTDGQTVALKPGCSYFITMNPGYAGRQELPENLKSLFRGVCMMVPDFGLIMRVKLASCGFQENAILAKKFFILYELCKLQLSKQTHYDFGLRNILSVLRTAGKVKQNDQTGYEPMLMMRTVRDMNMSKFVAEDAPLFLSLIGDLWPGIEAAKAVFPEIEAAMKSECEKMNLQYDKAINWAGKCVQLLETYYVRHGIGIVGPTGSGKTMMQEVLSRGLTITDVKHVLLKMNPKAITDKQMFGKLDPTTGDWTDGIFAVLWRKGTKAKGQNTWIVLDGPVDAIWIENLNTVLDDNKLLTLANGDRIPMSPAMKAMFEPENLMNASPATVSRMGIIYVSVTVLGWEPLVPSWINLQREKERELLERLVLQYTPPLLECVNRTCSPVMFSTDGIYLNSFFKIIDEVLRPLIETKTFLSPEHMEKVFIWAMCWSLGALLELEDRKKFNEKLQAVADPAQFPPVGDETAYEFFVDSKGDWQHWKTQVTEWHYPTDVDPSFGELLLPTLDSLRYVYQLNMLVPADKPVLFTGAPGVSKSATIQMFVSGLDLDKWHKKMVPFSFVTSPEIFQRTLESCVEKRQGRTFGPPGGKKCAFFVDDISMPVINNWGDQITNEIVRQCLDEKGCYNLDKAGEWRIFADMGYIGAMVHPGGGRNDVPHRLKRQFNLINVTMPSLAAINNIFGNIMHGRLSTESPFHAVPQVVADAVGKLTEATIELWQRTSTKMLPTPTKFHYSWNMREISRVFGGMFMASRDVIVDEVYLIRLWRHECERVFTDKLINAVDKDWENKTIMAVIEQVYGKDLAARVAGPCYFVNFLKDAVFDDDGVCIDERPQSYEFQSELPPVRTKALAFQDQFNEENKVGKLELVLFEYALEHLMRISRCMCQDRGSMMLVGVGGSGKQSLTRLASYIAGNFIFQISITKYYSVSNLFDDIKVLYKTAGLKGKPVTFIFTDAEVKEEGFLEYINQILATGEVSNLFPKDEMDAILGDLRPAAKKAKIIDTTENLTKFFFDRVRSMLHVVLCMSPVGDKLSSRSRKFPGLINCTTVDWFLAWPEEGLLNVSEKFITDFPMETSAECKKGLIAHMAKVHSLVTQATAEYFSSFRRNVYVTPKSYLSFLQTYTGVYTDQFQQIKMLADKINNGLIKLEEAAQDVAKMQIELKKTEVVLQEAAAKSAVLLKEITAGTAAAEKTKAEVKVVADMAGEKATVIGAEKVEVEKDLEAAKPALVEAESALDAIKAADIKDLAKLGKPPEVIKVIFDAVLILKHSPVLKCQVTDIKGIPIYVTNYAEAQSSRNSMMGDANAFVQSLQQFPKENITDEDCELLAPYTDSPLFTVEMANKASSLAVGLCKWCKAMKTYHEIAKVVIPKMDALRIKEAELATANKQLAQAQAQLAAAQASLDEMQEKFDTAMAEKQKLQDEADNTKRKMDAANSLISGLSGEKVRWTQQSKEFDDQIARLVGDCAISCAFLSYLGPFNKIFRDKLTKVSFVNDINERKLPTTKNLDISGMLVDSATTGEWNLQGLPTDDLSIQNGILTTRASRYPLMVDPQGQGLSWIRSKEHDNGVKETSFQDKGFRVKLEQCMEGGMPLLLANVENELDPVLDPVLDKAFIKKGKNFIVALSDKECDIDPEKFSLCITTRLPNPHFTPELSARVTIIDFTVTIKGLEDQLLARVVLQEKPELESERTKLQTEVNGYQKKLVELQDDLLYRLSSCEGSLLDDPEIVDVLNLGKATAKEVQEKLKNAGEAEVRIRSACEEYRPVATRGSIIYFLIAEMTGINVMYQTSLMQFVAVFQKSMIDAKEDRVPKKRIDNIIEQMSWASYLYIGRGLFERHKDVFAAMMTIKVQLQADIINADQFGCYVKGGAALDINAQRKKPGNWITDNSWLNAIQLSMSDALFKDLPEAIFRGDKQWKEWMDKDAPEAERVPDFEDRLDKFHRMLVIRALRPDRTMVVTREYIADAMGERYASFPPLNLETTHGESINRIPFVCILSMGSDPTELILNLAKKKKKEVLSVSMGQGQEIVARRYMDQGAATGCWALFQNCHLGLKFLEEVEQRLSSDEVFDEDFRVWVTAEPHPQFPIGLLQMSIKLTNEAPVGMKAGMKRSYAGFSQDTLDTVQRSEWKTLLWVLCHCHSVTQERRKFGAIGWTVPYEFNQSDLNACTLFMQNHLLEMEAKKAKEVTWTTVRYMVADIQYGGRITDDMDRRQMTAISENFFRQEVLEPGYSFLKGYSIPQGNDINIFRKHIEENLPNVDPPEVVGLNQNADLTFRLQEASTFFDTILETQPRGGGGGGKSPEEIVTELCNDFLSKVPNDFNKDEQRSALNKMGNTKPVIIAFRQEMDVMARVVKTVRTTLKNLKLAMDGTIVMSDDLANAQDSLFNAKVPALWLKGNWFSPTVGVWFGILLNRYEQWDKWLKHGRPKSYWLPGFSNGSGFLTAVKQEVCRANSGWALDDVVTFTEVHKIDFEEVRDAPSMGVYVHGLYLEGASWSKKEAHLIEAARGELIKLLPCMFITGVLKQQKKNDPLAYECPVYFRFDPRKRGLTAAQPNYMFSPEIKSVDPPSKWILRGVALLTYPGD